jgi:hypothetical protein
MVVLSAILAGQRRGQTQIFRQGAVQLHAHRRRWRDR